MVRRHIERGEKKDHADKRTIADQRDRCRPLLSLVTRPLPLLRLGRDPPLPPPLPPTLTTSPLPGSLSDPLSDASSTGALPRPTPAPRPPRAAPLSGSQSPRSLG